MPEIVYTGPSNDRLALPHDCVPPVRCGIVLPPQSKPGQWAPMASSAVEIIPEGDWPAEIEKKADRRHLVWHRYNQRSVGSCASEGCGGGLTFIREVAGLPRVQFNPWSVYRIVSGGYDRGSSLDANLKQYRDVGVLPESYFPRWGANANRWNSRPPSGWEEIAQHYRIGEWYYVRNKVEFGSCLLAGHCVYFGYPGHAILAVDLVDSDTILYLNSWGNWGDNGFGTLSWRNVEWGYGAYSTNTPIYSDFVYGDAA